MENEKGGTYSMHCKDVNVIKNLVGKPEGKMQYNIKMYLKEIGCGLD
jgi:hypothetical protein